MTRARMLAFAALANMPDLDYLPGLAVGALNRYHHQWTHTLGFAVAVSLLFVWRIRDPFFKGWRGLWLVLLVTGSHLLADVYTADGSEPRGICALWPLDDRRCIAESPVFPSWRKHELKDVGSIANLRPALSEIVLVAPWTLSAAVLYGLQRRAARRDQPLAAQ